MLPLHQRRVCCFSGSDLSGCADRCPTRTHKSRSRPPVFKTGPSSSRMTSVLSSCGSWNRTGHRPGMDAWVGPSWFRARRHYQQQLPRSVVVLKHSVRESHPICELQRLTPRLRAGESALRSRSAPRQVGSLEPLPLGQGHMLFPAEGEGVEPSRP